jgi:hypothetical protein
MVAGASLAALPNVSCPEGIIVALAEQRDDSKLRNLVSPTAPQVRNSRPAWLWISLLRESDSGRLAFQRTCGQVPITLARAVEWQRQLAGGEVRSRAEIARREGLSRARVTQILGRRQPQPRTGTGKPYGQAVQ